MKDIDDLLRGMGCPKKATMTARIIADGEA